MARREGFFILMIFFTLFACAEVNLVVTAQINQSSTSVFIQTNKKAKVWYESYDLEYPPFPGERDLLFSSLENKELIMDAWDKGLREIQLVLTRDGTSELPLLIEFKGDVSPTFKVVLSDYGTDSSFSHKQSSQSISGNSVYTTRSHEQKRYFILSIDYLFCGDGICSADEDCSLCAIDCSCENASLNSEKSPYYFVMPDEITSGVERTFTVSEGYSFQFKDKGYFLVLQSVVSDEAAFLLMPTNKQIIIEQGIVTDIDIDDDSESDISIASSTISPESVQLSLQGINPSYFSTPTVAPLQNNQKRSIFDESITIANVPVFKIILYAGILILSLWAIGILFFLIKRFLFRQTVALPVLVQSV